MKITAKLPQFSDLRALFIVTGRQEAVLYIAHKGQITKKSTIIVEGAKYTDREGFSLRSGHGRVLSSGSAYEPLQAQKKRDFLKVFKTEMAKFLKANPCDVIYVFSPNYAISEVKKTLPATAQKMVKFTRQGDYFKEHPFALIEMLVKNKPTVIPTSDEAAKILLRKANNK